MMLFFRVFLQRAAPSRYTDSEGSWTVSRSRWWHLELASMRIELFNSVADSMLTVLIVSGNHSHFA
jgi:hypothetical protein